MTTHSPFIVQSVNSQSVITLDGEKGLVTGVESTLAYVLAVLKEKPDFSDFKPADLKELIARL